MDMATLILKQETPERLVYVTNPDNHKGNIITRWIKPDKSETTVIFNLRYQNITRAKTDPKHPMEQTELSLTHVKDITLFSVDYSPMPTEAWPSVVAFTLLDGSSFVFDSGRHDKMKSLADKISRVIKKSVEERTVFTPKDFPK